MKDVYKVFFHDGPEIGLKTHVLRGTASIDASGLNIKGPVGSSLIPSGSIKEVELFRLHGTMRVIRVDHQGGRLYLAVVRFMIGQFASVNYFKTGELHKKLEGMAKSPRQSGV
ncbi:MAG: hypothetical protein WB524_21100 [Acidobacteriaceae bacterium]|jgi:hypothetical protein